ncbi:hypothetical protein AGMMS49965_15450 [Bacteroidia bacterium]|nr:hypothetical protein AGMMS49965_15450 [Bacteroidia bacterium]
MKANAKGLVIALLASFVLAQCSDRSEELEQTEMPRVFDNNAVKTAVTQQSVEFFLTAEFPDAEWTVYSSATGSGKAAGVTVECIGGTVLVLTHVTDIYPATYFVTATDPGKAESLRMRLSVSPQAQTPVPMVSIATVSKSEALQASVPFSIDNVGAYSAATQWVLYANGTGTGGRITDITASLNGDVLTLTHHSSDVWVGVYFLAAIDAGKSESPRLHLEVLPNDPTRTRAPNPANAIVAKTTSTQPGVPFTMLNLYLNPQWKVYVSATEASEAIVTPSYSGNTLTLSYNSLDVPTGIYYVTATDVGLKESARVKLTISPYTAVPTANPTTALPSVAKTATTQQSVVFLLTNIPTFPLNTTWKVYSVSSGIATALNITATHNGANLTLKHTTDIPVGNYWVSATEGSKAESERLALQVTAFEPLKTATPTVATADIIKNGVQPAVTFTLTNLPAYLLTTTWKVYAAATGTALADGVTAANVGTVLTLSHRTDVPEQIHYVAATEPNKLESERLALTVAKDRTPTPIFAVSTITKDSLTQPTADFILLNDDPAVYPGNANPDTTFWTVYGDANTTTPLFDVSVTFNRTGSSGTFLTLTDTLGIKARNYWLAATVPGKIESERVRLTVVDYTMGVTPTPTTSTPILAKTSASQPTISFPIDNAAAYSSGTYTWKVYSEQTSTTEATYISASLFSGSLVLADVNGVNVPTGNFWVTATESGFAGKAESGRLKLTITAYVPNVIQTPTPITSSAVVAKTIATQPSVDFPLNNFAAYSSATIWKVYSAATGAGLDGNITASFIGTTLRLTSSTGDVTAASYYITATNLAVESSGRLRLVVTAYAQGVTPTPIVSAPSYVKTSPQQASINFIVDNGDLYRVGGTTWKVYTSQAGTTTAPGITPNFNSANKTLTLFHSSDVPNESYWITVTDAGKTESGRLKVLVSAYVPGVTPTPKVASVAIEKTSVTQSGVDFTLTNATAYSNTTIWKVYNTLEGAVVDGDVTATLSSPLLWLTSGTSDVTAKDYYITATNAPTDAESGRLKLTVRPDGTGGSTGGGGVLEIVATPTATPGAGTYSGPQTVSLATTTPGATIHYTVDGTVPTTSSTVYSTPIAVSMGTVLKAIAVKTGMTASAMLIADYTPTGTVVTPTANPGAGSYAGPQTVRLASSTPGTTIYYTLNGTIPTTSSTVYNNSTPITVNMGTTLRAIAVRATMVNSAVLTAQYTAVPALTGSVGINGTLLVGYPLSANTTSLGGRGTISYQWKRGAANIGTNSPVYTLTAADAGAVITVEVSRAGYTGVRTASITVPLVVTPALTGSVSIDGIAEVDQTLAANINLLGGSGNISYQWKGDGVNVGSNGPIYALKAADLGKPFTVEVSRAGYTGSVISTPTAAVVLPILTGSVTIDGLAEVGQTLTANIMYLDGSGAISYQWKRNGVNISGGTGQTYTSVTTADIGKTFTVEVTRTGNTGSITSTAIGPVIASIPPLTGTVSINGIDSIGYTLTANISSLGGSGTIAYQWKRSGVNVGTNSSTYVVTVADEGSSLTVEVSRAGNSGSVISNPTAVVPPLTRVATPTAIPPGGAYSTSPSVYLSSTTPGAQIYYTVNGTPPATSPTAYTTLYTTHLSANISSAAPTRTVRAIAVAPGMPNSAEMTEIYRYDATAAPAPPPVFAVATTTPKFKISQAAPAQNVVFDLAGLENYPLVKVRVYDAATGGNDLTATTGTGSGATLQTSYSREASKATVTIGSIARTVIPVGDYWITMTVPGMFESSRVKVTVTSAPLPLSVTPILYPVKFECYPGEHYPKQDKLNITLTTSYPSGTQIYLFRDDAPSTELVADITTEYNVEEKSLVLGLNNNVHSGDYWVAVQEPGKDMSARIKVAIIRYHLTQPVSPNLNVKFSTNQGFTYILRQLHELISYPYPGDDFTKIIRLGDYLDLPPVGGRHLPNNEEFIDDLGSHGYLRRLIVVGLNSFKRDGGLVNNPNAPDHLVFQFENVPYLNREMFYGTFEDHKYIARNKGGYATSLVRSYVTEALMNDLFTNCMYMDTTMVKTMVWAPKRQMANGPLYYGTGVDVLEDKLWIPTEWEMTGKHLTSIWQLEPGTGQARLEYYTTDDRRAKYNRKGSFIAGKYYADCRTRYWLASAGSFRVFYTHLQIDHKYIYYEEAPTNDIYGSLTPEWVVEYHDTNAPAVLGTTFATIDINGYPGFSPTNHTAGISPAFCFK